MSWQEELRRLDAELAAGAISSNEHRRRREDILAEVSGAPLLPQAPATTSTGSSGSATTDGAKTSEAPTSSDASTASTAEPSTPTAEPSTPPSTAPAEPAPTASEDSQETSAETAVPQSSAPDWRATNPARAAGDSTGSTSTGTASEEPYQSPEPPKSPALNAAALLSGDTPTTAPSPADERPTELIRYPDFSHLPPPEGDRPPVTGNDSPRRPGLTWVAVSGAVLLALGAVIGGAWWLGQDSSTPAPSAVASPDDGMPGKTGADERTEEAALADRLPSLPGEQSPNNSTMSVERGMEIGLYPAKTAEFFTEHGVTEVIVRGSLDGSTGYQLLVLRTEEPAQAQAVAEYLYQVTLSEKQSQSEGPLYMASGPFGEKQVSGAWYASGEYTVAMVITEPADGDNAELTDRLQHMVDSLQEVLPVGR
ncbi:hypothetical protein [Saccharomonospora sp.]|uniref:hypothetical protein n=1 Tax=Saccharomonospora sp. TaxID=33913 RepID=UPI002609BE74|nr:hypothetical protein [Saccharomonospora sp.]